MVTTVDVNEFINEKECIFEGERYSVRDNGAVLRHPPIGKRVRPSDNNWTFGKTNTANPYLHIAGVRIHRIVATAFLGDPPDPQYVVDHMDSNGRNNRPENLRWVTRLENALLNPATRKKIIFHCGSIEAFLDDPSILQSKIIEPNYAWMRTVSKEEAQISKERMANWAATEKKPTGGTLGEWVYKKQTREYLDNKGSHQKNINEYYNEYSDQTTALTQRCVQRSWKVPSYFPCCPEEIGTNPLDAYVQNLKVGALFSYNDKYPESVIVDTARIKNNASILVFCQKENLKPWSLTEITFENGLFVHSSLGTFFERKGAEKVFCIKQGKEWTGGDSIDDYC